MLLDKRKRNLELKFNPGLTLIDLRTIGAQDSGIGKQNFSQSGIQTTLYGAKS